MKELLNAIEELGIDPMQAGLYLAALKTGGGTITELAREGKLERTALYRHLDQMIALGLLRIAGKGARTIYLASDPARLHELLEKKEKAFSSALPKLEAMFGAVSGKSTVNYFQGKEGLTNLYEEVFKMAGQTLTEPDDCLYIFGRSFEALEALPDFFPDYISRRKKSQFKTKIILPRSERPRANILKTQDPYLIAKYNLHIPERKYLELRYTNEGVAIILKDRVASIDFKTFFGAITENKNLTQTWRVFFEFMWDHL